MAATLVQASLRSGTAVRTCWVEDRIKTGDRITLKNSEDPDRLWDVAEVGSERRTATEINRGWNNNI